MPELPEVEVLVRHLDPLLRGARIRDVSVRRARVVRPHSPAELRSALIGQRIQRVERRAKHIIFHLNGRRDRASLLIGHLGMTGRMFVQSKKRALPQHAAVVLDLDRDRFVFEDTRYFGRFHLEGSDLDGLGPEPLGDSFTVEGFSQALRKSSQAIKVKLLDQSCLAGVGNIYASEALFRARISPRRASHRLSRDEIARLQRAIQEVLTEAIQRGSTLPLDFARGRGGLFYYGTTSESNPAEAHEFLRVYDRQGRPCHVCGAAIEKIVQAARSTFFCPRCQRRD